MFFGVLLSEEAQLPRWRESLRGHADWLGLALTFESIGGGEPPSLSVGRCAPGALSLPPLETEEHGLALPIPSPHGPAGTADAARVTLFQARGEIRVESGSTTVEPIYYSRSQDGVCISNDLRFMARWNGADIDSHGLSALLRYGAISPPFTLLRGVSRLAPGSRWSVSLSSGEPGCETTGGLLPLVSDDSDLDSWRDSYLTHLDSLLQGYPQGTALMFSGGVDSGLLAARLAHLGRRDVTLLNLSFSRDDPESRLAERMAAHLGLRMERVLYDPDEPVSILDSVTQDYSFPFCDRSTIPTLFLIRETLVRSPAFPAIIDGTGADGEFGVGLKYPQWQRIYRLPTALRRLVGGLYGRLDWWTRSSSDPLERLGRLARRSVRMPLPHAALLATSPLEGLLYRIPSRIGTDVEQALLTWVKRLSGRRDTQDQFSFLDMIQVCAGIYAAKTLDPVRRIGVRPVYPYLEPESVRLGFALPWSVRCAGGVPKKVLKDLLARQVPEEMVFRPKMGFLPPFARYLAQPVNHERIREEILARNNPFLEPINRDLLVRMLDRGRRGLDLSGGCHQLIWLLAFASAWYRQLKAGLP